MMSGYVPEKLCKIDARVKEDTPLKLANLESTKGVDISRVDCVCTFKNV